VLLPYEVEEHVTEWVAAAGVAGQRRIVASNAGMTARRSTLRTLLDLVPVCLIVHLPSWP
jgi:hypothetical protein